MKEIDRGRIRTVKLAVFFGTLAVLCVIGILLPRPAESEIEKRRLTEFPAFSWASFWDGSWFSGIDKWYADTYPLRETLIAGNKAVQGLRAGDRRDHSGGPRPGASGKPGHPGGLPR